MGQPRNKILLKYNLEKILSQTIDTIRRSRTITHPHQTDFTGKSTIPAA
jgi:hypothetical protein